MTDDEPTFRTLRDALVEEMRTHEARNDAVLTVYLQRPGTDSWEEVSVATLDDYIVRGGELDVVVYSTEYVYVLQRAKRSTLTIPIWTFQGVPRQKRLFGLKRTDDSTAQAQFTEFAPESEDNR